MRRSVFNIDGFSYDNLMLPSYEMRNIFTILLKDFCLELALQAQHRGTYSCEAWILDDEDIVLIFVQCILKLSTTSYILLINIFQSVTKLLYI